ncbi:MAG TPA: hypothetical protein VG074_14535, partial [Acidimicrobiales bacterium]|nr:hypothetical protein [Acidimicrobiales bacterium]
GTVAGNDVVYEGCTDTTAPLDDIALELPQSLYFAGWSHRAWGGTAAGFITLGARKPPTLARAYLIAPTQFQEIVRQENAHVASVEGIELDLDQAREHGHTRILSQGHYSELIYCGERDGYPMLTFTASENRTDFNRPSPPYLRMIHAGLQESHGLSTDDAVAYLRGKPGIRGRWTAAQLVECLAG